MDFANDRESMVWTSAVAAALASGQKAEPAIKGADVVVSSFRKRQAKLEARFDDDLGPVDPRHGPTGAGR